MSKQEYTPESAATGVEQAISSFGGRWKLVILFHLFGGNVLRFSDLERAIPAVSQKMLAQQLRQLERDGMSDGSCTHRSRQRSSMNSPAGDSLFVLPLTLF